MTSGQDHRDVCGSSHEHERQEGQTNQRRWNPKGRNCLVESLAEEPDALDDGPYVRVGLEVSRGGFVIEGVRPQIALQGLR